MKKFLVLVSALLFTLSAFAQKPNVQNTDTNAIPDWKNPAIVGTSIFDKVVTSAAIDPVRIDGWDEAIGISRPMLNGDFISSLSSQYLGRFFKDS
ncbi:MAG: hypothetical protein WCG27_03025, partial [Pseudomonadota bacterium]